MAAAGDVLAGRYRLESALGAGGMATVHRAQDTLLGRPVAVKILAANVAANPAHLERFGREARAMATISHPNLVAIYDVGWVDEQAGSAPFLVMELVSGGTLAERLAAEGPLDPPEVIALVEGLASALDVLHRAGIVHRDVKPQNVLLAPSGPKLADLGVIRMDDPSDPEAAALTASGAVPGTLRFLAPEVIFGQSAGPKADAYALAMVAYEAITGRSPRPAMTLGELVHGAWEPVTPVSEAKPELGTSFDAPFAAALDLDPNRRLEPLAFAAELWEAVTAWAVPRDLPDAAPPTVATTAQLAAGSDAESPDAAAGGVDLGTVGESVGAPTTEFAALSGVARPNPTALLSDDMTTAVDRPAIARPAAARPAAARPAADRPTGSRRVIAREDPRGDPAAKVLAGLGVVALVLGVVVFGLLATQSGGAPNASVPGAFESGAAESSPDSSSAPAPSPTVSDDVAAAARQALEAVEAAIEQARGGRDGLKGGDANELASLAAEVGRALEAGDFGEARKATDELAKRVDKVDGDLGDARRDALEQAIEDLRAAIPAA